MYVRDLEGKEVVSKDGAVVGKTTNAVVDTGLWRVVSVEINLDDTIAEQLRMKKMFRSTTMPVPVEQVEAVGDKLLLKSRESEIVAMLAAAGTQHKALDQS
jgi:sporulation protein YlmC with PRC-barrel domain